MAVGGRMGADQRVITRMPLVVSLVIEARRRR